MLDLILIASPWLAMAVGYVVQRELEYRRWRRLAAIFEPQPIANLTPPTVTELSRPSWMEEA